MATDARTEALLQYLAEVAPDLDLHSYYQLLDVPEDVSPDAVRAAFYQKAAALHPDRFPGLTDRRAHDQLVSIYARIAEGYRILSDARKRVAYDQGLAEGRTRFAEGEREKKGPRNPEESLTNEQARKFLRLALQARDAGDLKGAAMNLGFARSFEPGAEVLTMLAAQIDEKLKGQAGGGQ
ncbi:MAG: DnaJ domain-containing protein [Deltaproteobacteria bacterium]|nr:DnaJ domain-containing protein [Deltaproteobacteria bacterium]